jgi:phosphate starvation-inducible PhoH-like protein
MFMARKKRNGNGYFSVLGNGSNGNGSTNGNGNSNSSVEKRSPTKQPIQITAKSPNQKTLLKSISENIVTIVTGPAGSGKTLLAVTCGLYDFIRGKYKKMIFTRPCVEAVGENLGFLPGDLNEKIQPYMYPIFNFLSFYLTPQKIEGYVRSEEIITLPLAYQRGMTFADSFVLLDEAQNTKVDQVHMFLTRIGENCKVVITGDPYQSDIRGKNGLVDACERLVGVPGLGIVQFTEDDIVRSQIVIDIEKRYSLNIPAESKKEL